MIVIRQSSCRKAFEIEEMTQRSEHTGSGGYNVNEVDQLWILSIMLILEANLRNFPWSEAWKVYFDTVGNEALLLLGFHRRWSRAYHRELIFRLALALEIVSGWDLPSRRGSWHCVTSSIPSVYSNAKKHLWVLHAIAMVLLWLCRITNAQGKIVAEFVTGQFARRMKNSYLWSYDRTER